MKVLEFMSFNVDWFLTTQGMLITGGVVLLLIALIILLTSGKKNKEDDESVEQAEFNPMGTMQNQPMPGMVQPELGQQMPYSNANMDMPLGANVNVGSTEQVNVNNEPQEPAVINFDAPAAPVEPLQTNVNPINQVESVAEVPASPVLEINVPAAEPVVPEIPVVPPMSMEENAFNINQTAPIVEQPAAQQQPSVSIYGGVNPTQDIYKPVEQPKPIIYGGADPLENTAPIPKVDLPQQPPMPTPEARVVETPQPVDVMPQTAVTNNMSTPTIPEVPIAPAIQPKEDEVEELVF